LIKERKTLLKSGDSTDSISAMNSPNQSNYSSPKLYESSNNKINNQEIVCRINLIFNNILFYLYIIIIFLFIKKKKKKIKFIIFNF